MTGTSMPADVSSARIDRFAGMGFSVCFPYNHDPALWERLSPFADVVEEVYAELHPDVFPSMRTMKGQLSPDDHMGNLSRLMSEVKGHDVALDLILNACPTDWVDEHALFGCIGRLLAEGEVRVTISDFYWAMRLRKEFPDLHLGVSTTVEVDNQNAAMIWRDLVGVETVVIGRRINKDPRRIKEIRDLGVRIKMVVSDTCTDDCPLRPRHFALFGQKKDLADMACVEERLLYVCAGLKHELPVWHLVKKTVLPFQLPRYEGLVDMVKLNDRRKDTDTNIDNLVRYLDMEDDVHPMFGYRESPETFDYLSRCRRTCADCTWCAENIEILHPRNDLPTLTEIRLSEET